MNTELYPPRGRIVLQIIEKPKPAQKIILVEEKPDRYVEAQIVGYHPLSEDFDKGDVVLIDRYAGHHVTIDGLEYVIMKEEEILSRIERCDIKTVCKKN